MLSFARTKIQPPRARAGALLARPHLQQRLVDAMLSHALVLVTASAGYGKTSALTQALAALPPRTAVAWIGCDRGDSPLQLFTCLVAALEPFDLPWRTAPEALFATALEGGADSAARTRARRHMVSELINAMDACENVPHGVIVVDDLHRIEHPDVFDFIDLLLDRFTPRWSLVLASRHTPPIALHRLRAQGDLAEFGADDLRFDAAQAHELVCASGLEDAALADSLHERTQGWPAGLRLALNVLRGAPGATLSGTASLIDRQVFEFLAAEVIDRLPPELRRFLLHTAVLPELTASRCAALTGDPRAAEHLEAIERAGLFVTSMAEAEVTLRLHDLFRDALEHRLQREHPEELPGLLERAARSESDGLRRLGYWMRAERWDEAARDLHLQSYSLLTGDQAATVQRWLERFPPAASTLPDLNLVRTLLAWMYWRWSEMVVASQAAAEGFERAGRPLDALAARAYGVLALRGDRRREESEALARRVARDVDALLAEREDERRAGKRWDGNEPGMLAAMLGRESASWSAFDDARFDELAAPLAASVELLDRTTGTAPFFQMLPLPDFVGLAGLHPVLLAYVRKARARLGRDDGHLATLVNAIEGSVRVWAGEVEAGEALLREAEADVRWHGFPLRGSLHVYPFLCVAAVLRDDPGALAAAGATLEATLRRATELPDIGHRTVGEYAALARLYLLGGLTDDALRVWRLIEPYKPERERPFWAWQRESGAGYVALTAGHLAQAEQVFSAALAAHGARLDLNGQATELALRVASLRLRLGRPAAEAARVLGPVFARHAGDADIAAVWLFGLPGLHELAQAPWGAALGREHIDALTRWAEGLAALRGASPPRPAAAPGAGAAATRDILSERELEVLERIAAGDSNKLIARAFDLSPHTVKRHVANILDKLALRSRGQAAAWFHDHGSA